VLHFDIVLCNRVIPCQITHRWKLDHLSIFTKYSTYWSMSLAYVQNSAFYPVYLLT